MYVLGLFWKWYKWENIWKNPSEQGLAYITATTAAAAPPPLPPKALIAHLEVVFLYFSG